MDNEMIYRKPKKRRRLIGLIVSAVILLLVGIGGWLMLRVPKPRNVFEEMYNDRVYSDSHPLLYNMPVEIVYEHPDPFGSNPDPWSWMAPKSAYVYVYYDKSKIDGAGLSPLNENEYIFIYFYKDKTKAVVLEHGYFEHNGMGNRWRRYTYNMKTQELSYSSNYINTKDSFLYDRVLADWFDHNAEKSAFSMENLGEFTDIE